MALRVQISNTNKRQKGRNPVDVRSSMFINVPKPVLGKSIIPKSNLNANTNVGIIAREPGQLRLSQLIAAEKVVLKALKKIPNSHYDLRVYPHIPLTKKPNETGLGRGKGPINDRVCRVAKGQMIMQIRLKAEPAT